MRRRTASNPKLSSIKPHTDKLGTATGVETAAAVTVLVSVALLLPRAGSIIPLGVVTVAVLLSVPVAEGDTVPLTV